MKSVQDAVPRNFMGRTAEHIAVDLAVFKLWALGLVLCSPTLPLGHLHDSLAAQIQSSGWQRYQTVPAASLLPGSPANGENVQVPAVPFFFMTS